MPSGAPASKGVCKPQTPRAAARVCRRQLLALLQEQQARVVGAAAVHAAAQKWSCGKASTNAAVVLASSTRRRPACAETCTALPPFVSNQHRRQSALFKLNSFTKLGTWNLHVAGYAQSTISF